MKPFILLLLIILSCSMVAAEKDISVLVIHKQPTREMAMSAQSAQEPQIPLDIDIDRQYSAIDAYSATVDEATLEQLLSDPNIEVRMNGVKYIQLSDSVPIIRADQTRIAKVNNFNLTGQGQTVCILDTGIDTDHSAFTGRIKAQYCFCNDGLGGCCPDTTTEDTSAEDDHSHGTHVAGIAAGNYPSKIGVAPGAGIIAIKVCSAGGACGDADIIAGIDWCTYNASKFNISVISMSLGDASTKYNSYCLGDSMSPSIQAAVRKNISVVIASGNNGYDDGISSPACVENATPVGATTKADAITYNRGFILDLLAPGVSITAPINTGGTGTKSGTSMATPHVSGAALILNQYAKLQGNTLTPHEVKVALNSTGKLIDDTANSGKSYSRIDVYSAISSLNTAPNITSFYPLSSQNIIEPQNQTFNITYTDLNNDDITIVWYKNGTAVGSSAEYNFTGNFFTSGSYNITVIITDGINSTHHSWNLTVNNTNRLPTVQSLLSSSDPGNRTNGTLTADWITSDPDTDDSYLNQTRWYNNSIEQIQLENMTELNSANTSKNQLWTVSVRTFDGTIWSNWSNASLQIKNSIPVVQHLQDITVLEKARINISVNATDEDNDQLIYMINDSRFTQNIENFTWTPNLTQSGTYIVSINVSDGEVVQWQNITITVLNAPDFDNDGNPDYNDTDDDNDNILDGQDTLDGNSSTINSTVSIILLINDSTNITRGLNNTQRVNLTDQRNNSIISFDWNFTRSRLTLNFTINYNASAGTIIINKLDLTGQQKTKTVYINKSSAAYNYICIADYEVQSITEITADCTGANEKKVPCTGTLGQYTCTDLGTIFKVTGLNHSAVKGITVTTSTGGTGGGGGGGGSSTTTAIAVKEPCVEDWTCNPWSECIDGKTKRACADINRCKTELDKPETEKTCTPEPVLVQIPEIKEQPQPAQETVTQPQQPVELSAPFNFTPILIMTLLLISAASIILLFPKIRSKITDKKLHHHINKYLENHSEKEIYSKLMKTGWGREIIKKKNPK